jgi:peptidoglycan-associated lipoprotein
MRNRIFLFALLSVAAVLALGCSHTKRPTPADTLFHPAKPSADWVDPSKIYGAGADGLTGRDANFINANSKRIEDMFEPVYFQFDKSAVDKTERAKIDKVAEYLKGNPNDKMVVEGYCDWRGTTEYNLALGDRRANGVKQRLLDDGVDPARVQTLSHGDLLATENASESIMKKDRKGAFVVIKE